MGWKEFFAAAQERHGAYAVRDAPTYGLTADAVTAMARRHEWDRRHRGVGVVAGMEAGHLSRLAAAQLFLAPAAAAAGASAAWLHGLRTRPPSVPHLVVPHERRRDARGLIVHRSRLITPDDRTEVHGVVTVTAAFMLITLAPRASEDLLFGYALDARQRGLLDTDDFAERVADLAGAPGSARLHRLSWRLLTDGSDSKFESKVRGRLIADGFMPSAEPTPVQASDGRTLHLDITFPTQRVAVECLGFDAHHSRDQLDRDARRDNNLALTREWLVLKLTYARYVRDWGGFTAELRQALDARHLRAG